MRYAKTLSTSAIDLALRLWPLLCAIWLATVLLAGKAIAIVEPWERAEMLALLVASAYSIIRLVRFLWLGVALVAATVGLALAEVEMHG